MKNITRLLIAPSFTLLFLSCDEKADVLASYESGRRPLSGISIQDSVYAPKVTWLGGYITAFGINQGSTPALDSTLAWLVKVDGNNLKYPVVVGDTPQGGQDVTAQYGGLSVSQLTEDTDYTFWIMKQEAWRTVSLQPNKILKVDLTATVSVRGQGDTLYIEPVSFASLKRRIDIFVNVKDVDPRGRLGTILITKSDTSSNPFIQFSITQTTDTAVAAIGLVKGLSRYDVNNVVWEVLSEDSSSGVPQYQTKNVISSPIWMGQKISGTRAFVEYSVKGLERNKLYYFWIATKDWDGLSRVRTANYYSWVTFETW